ncbi:MAG: L-lactate dehydrogenase complex protein LldF [Verrucomicrobiales bacterium]|jgi:L-lactate dehydrogenase complex protein LldF
MKSPQQIDRFANDLDPGMRKSIRTTISKMTERRAVSLERDYPDSDALRKLAGEIKQHTLEHLDEYLEQTEKSLKKAGAEVLFANTGDRANEIVLEIMRKHGAKRMVKSKTMVSEELELNPFLEENGIDVVETDLGEFIIQIDNDHPSHIVAPIIHKDRDSVAKSFEKNGLGEYNTDPETITRRARSYLRHKYIDADVGLTGANLISAESGRLAIVTNEGNARFSISANRVHIALVGIEKIIPRDRDLSLFLALLGRSATGQQLSVYTQFVNGPRAAAAGQPDGPDHFYVIFVDNGRTDVLASDYKEILRCIRCGACLNVCPVFRQSGGHAYRSVYPGPVGAVLTPLLRHAEYPEYADLPKASSLCGACKEVCPVDIPIPDMLLKLRDKAKTEKAGEAMKGSPPMGMWSILATQPTAWKSAMKMSNLANLAPLQLVPMPALQRWISNRDLPKFRGGKFRKWLKTRRKNES